MDDGGSPLNGDSLMAHLVLDNLIREKSLRIVGEMQLVTNEAEVLVSVSALDVCVRISECDAVRKK